MVESLEIDDADEERPLEPRFKYDRIVGRDAIEVSFFLILFFYNEIDISNEREGIRFFILERSRDICKLKKKGNFRDKVKINEVSVGKEPNRDMHSGARKAAGCGHSIWLCLDDGSLGARRSSERSGQILRFCAKMAFVLFFFFLESRKGPTKV